jgi:hypothetical protein
MYNFPMSLRPGLRYFGLALLLVSALILTWGLRAETYQSKMVAITQADLDPSASAGSVPNANTVMGRLVLEWPQSLRLGDAGKVRLIFSPELSQLSHNATDRILRSRLDLAGFAQTPTGEISHALILDHPVTFLWNLRSIRMGKYIGDVWLYVQSNLPGVSDGNSKVVIAQQFEIPVTGLLGMSGLEARIIGGVGLVIGAFLGLGEWMIQIINSTTQKIY